MKNVIEFPKPPRDEIGQLPTTIEGAQANLEAVRHVYINEIAELIVGTMVQQMSTGGFEGILDEGNDKDFAFLIESVRSSLCKTAGIYHPFQDVSDKIMEACGDQPGVLIIADHINVKFQDEKAR